MIIIMVFQAINQVFPDLYLTKQKVYVQFFLQIYSRSKGNRPAPGGS